MLHIQVYHINHQWICNPLEIEKILFHWIHLISLRILDCTVYTRGRITRVRRIPSLFNSR